MRIHLAALLAFSPALVARPAAAAPVTETFTIAASGFSDILSGTVPPVDPVQLKLQLTFDPTSGDQFDRSAGLVLLSSSTPVAGPFVFDYTSASDTLIFGGAGLSLDLTAGTNDVLAEITTPYTGRAGFGGLEYTTAASTGIYLGLTGSVAVPEPASASLLLGTLTAFGLRRRRA